MHLNIFVSQQCFCYCSGCYSFSREEKCDHILSTNVILKFLKYAYKSGIKRITLCGGDPLTRSDIIELLSEIKNIGYYISLDTLGTPIVKAIQIKNRKINKINVKLLSKLVDKIGIPIDGSNSEIINYFRNSNKDIFNQQLVICEKLNDYNANICVNVVVNRGNLNDIDGMVNLINELDYIGKWQFFQFVPSGKYGLINRKKIKINDLEFEYYKKNIIKKAKYKENLEFKSIKDRDEKYILIDNSGNAWLYSTQEHSFNRKIIGNIKNKKDWKKICFFVRKEIKL